MTASSVDQDQARRAHLAEIIVRRRKDIEQRWLECIPQSVKGRPVSRSELRDSMPEYLMRLADGLRAGGTAEDEGSSAWGDVARAHAETRVRLGFDIDQLVHEFIVLRRVLFAVLDEEEGKCFDVRETGTVADLIEGASAAAVKSYVDSRDYAARQREAEHVGFITHELRNPLNTALLCTAQLRASLSLPAEQCRVLDSAERSLRRIAELIDGILLAERNLHALKAQPVVSTLGQLLEQPVGAGKVAAQAKGLHLQARFDPDLAVLADTTLAASAIDNVLLNAVKFTDTGNVELVAEDGAAEVVIHVRDTGPGLSSDELRTIFEPFRRGQSRKSGSGLGLAIARRALEVQGGTIHAESALGKGCHFWLTLPKPRH